MKNLSIIGFCLVLGTTGLATAQSNVPQVGTLPVGQRSSRDVTSDIDQLLRSNSNDIMSGIQGYGIDFGEAITQKVMDEVVKAIAQAVMLAPVAAEIMDIYQKAKNKSLAGAVDEVKDVVKDMMSTQLKVRYQTFKVKYEKAEAGARMNDNVRNSVAQSSADASVAELRSSYDDVYNTVAGSSVKLRMLRETNPEIDQILLRSATGLSDNATIKAKLSLANQEYNRAGSSEVLAMSAYERMMFKREAAADAKRQNQGMAGIQVATRRAIEARQSVYMKRRYAKALGMTPSTY